MHSCACQDTIGTSTPTRTCLCHVRRGPCTRASGVTVGCRLKSKKKHHQKQLTSTTTRGRGIAKMLACAQQKAVCCTLFRGDGLALVNHRASGRPKSGQPAPRRSHCRRLAGGAGCLQHLSTSRLHAMPRTPCCRRLCRLPTASSGKPRLHATTSQPNNVSVCRPKVAGDTIGRLDPRGTRRGDMNERQLVELACAGAGPGPGLGRSRSTQQT